MADWLRPVFGRTRTPIPGMSGEDRPSSFPAEECHESEAGSMSRLRPSSRVSSYVGVRSSTPPITQTPDIFANIRNPESVYHKPSVDHMAETLKVVMMSQFSTATIPVEYNTCVLHVLEAYNNLRQELGKRDEMIEELKQNHTKNVKDFEGLATQWKLKERDYRLELKKLEVLLSKTEGGMEKVSLARSNSSVHGSRHVSEAIGRGISTIKDRNSARSSRYREDPATTEVSMPHRRVHDVNKAERSFRVRVSMNNQKNQPLDSSVMDASEEAAETSIYSSVIPERILDSSLVVCTTPQIDNQVSSLTRLRHGTSKGCVSGHELGISFESPISRSGSSAESNEGQMLIEGETLGVGQDLKDKPILDPTQKLIPQQAIQTVGGFADTFIQFDSDPRELPVPFQMSFSFQPGDDNEILARITTEEEAPREVLDKHIPQHVTISTQNGTLLSTTDGAKATRLSKRMPSSQRPKLKRSAKLGLPRDLFSNEALEHYASTSSVVTAVKGNVHQSNVNGSLHTNLGTSQRLNSRVSGANEAVAAAVRALAVAPGKIIMEQGNDAPGTSAQDASTRTESIQSNGNERVFQKSKERYISEPKF